MKMLLAIFLLVPVFAVAQNCALKDEKDQYNQDPRLTTGFKEFADSTEEFMFSVTADKREIDLFFSLTTSGSICFGDFSRAVVTFEGGKQRATFKNGGTTNCKSNFHFIFKNQENLPANLNNLSLKKIQKIQFVGNDDVKKAITPSPGEQERIMQMIACILKELESLRKDSWKPGQH
jgi:hypothetical protein